MSAADSLASVALRPWPAQAKEALSKDDVRSQLQQLTTERGHLRGITEKVMQDEIDAGRNVLENSAEESQQEQKDEASLKKEKLEEIGRVRNEVLTKLEWATFSAGNALNLVSLLLARDPAKHLESGYSDMFKAQNVPRGSFGLDKGNRQDRSNQIEERQRIADTAKRMELVQKGSRMKAFDSATDSLLKAATELEKEVRRETKYWEEVLSISEKGWSLQHLRRDTRYAPLAVRYGLPEASNHYKARGLAPLRMDKDGGIILDPTLALKPRTVRVRISENGETIGASQLPTQSEPSELAIEQSIQLARDSLFEEELFHEISMETRQLLAYKVEMRDSTIHITIPETSDEAKARKILIDCVARDEKIPTEGDHSRDWLAQNVGEGLRLLLAHAHRMRLHRRSQIPPPLTQQKRQQPTPPLLRTLLGVFAHLNAIDSLHAYMDVASKTLKSAGLDIQMEAARETSWVKLTDVIKESTKEDQPAIEQLLIAFTRPFEGSASLSLPSSTATQQERITVGTRTYIGPPHFGAEHKVILPPSLIKVLNLEHDQLRQFKFSSTEEVKSYLDWILSLDICHAFLAREYPGRSIIKGQDSRISIVSKGTRKDFVKENDVAIELENGVLKVTAAANVHLATGASIESFTWDGSIGQPSLKEKVKSWIG